MSRYSGSPTAYDTSLRSHVGRTRGNGKAGRREVAEEFSGEGNLSSANTDTEQKKYTIATNDLFRLYVKKGDTPPMHVHVKMMKHPKKNGRLLIVENDDGSLTCEVMPPGMGPRQIRDMEVLGAAKQFARQNLHGCIQTWRDLHGESAPIKREDTEPYLFPSNGHSADDWRASVHRPPRDFVMGK